MSIEAPPQPSADAATIADPAPARQALGVVAVLAGLRPARSSSH